MCCSQRFVLDNDRSARIRSEHSTEVLFMRWSGHDHRTRAAMRERITQGELRYRFTLRPDALHLFRTTEACALSGCEQNDRQVPHVRDVITSSSHPAMR